MSELDPLFYWRGISPNYYNYKGEFLTVPEENKIILLEAMEVDLSSKEKIKKEIFRLDVEPWLSWLESFFLSYASDPNFHINLTPEELEVELNWYLTSATGNEVAKGKFVGQNLEEVGDYLFEDVKYSRRKFSLEFSEPGYYELTLAYGDRKESATLAIAPETTFIPEWSERDTKIWGVIIHLYTLRSKTNWGIGDFSDLYNLVEYIGQSGGGVIGLNPLHSISPYLEESFSPYSPSDRRFINPLYIDVASIESFDEIAVSEKEKETISVLRSTDNVDYSRVARLKFPFFIALFNLFFDREIKNQTDKAKEFLNFLHSIEKPILEYANYELLNCKYIDKAFRKVGLKNLESVQFEKIARDLLLGKHKGITFFCYLQWVANKQLADCQEHAEALNMEIGLVKDLAVGADGGGSEVSSHTELFRLKASVGAPPDPMALTGQNWGIPPMDPAVLKETKFAHFIALLRANMSRCGALRIDHAMSLMRLWWCPPDLNAAAGGYVLYPFEQMLGLLCLESYLNECVIIGEDLGVVPDEFREGISKARVFSNKVFYFEKEANGEFRRPEHYDPNALAMVNNHDVPTLVSWWNGTDLSLRHELNMLEEGVSYEQVCDGRKFEKTSLVRLLRDSDLLPNGWDESQLDKPADQNLIEAILLFVSKTSSKIFVIQLEDLMMMNDPVNVPGTFKEHANWQRKLVKPIDDLFEDERINHFLNQINKQRN